MAVPQRAAFLGLGVVALALTVTGIVLAATDPNAGGNAKDPLALNGFPPRSAQLHVAISTGQRYSVTGDVNVNFQTNAVDAVVHVPMFFSSAGFDLRLVHHHLYAESANLSSIVGSSWISVSMGRPSLYGLSLEMTKPDVSLITGFTQRTVTHDGYLTTYDYRRANVSITTPKGLPAVVPTRGSVEISITVGRQGELTATGFTVTSKTSTATIKVTVLSYNGPAHIVAPPARDVKPVNTSQLNKLFGSTSLGQLLSPQNVASLGKIRLS